MKTKFLTLLFLLVFNLNAFAFSEDIINVLLYKQVIVHIKGNISIRGKLIKAITKENYNEISEESRKRGLNETNKIKKNKSINSSMIVIDTFANKDIANGRKIYIDINDILFIEER